MDKYSEQAEKMYSNEADTMDSQKREYVYVKSYKNIFNKMSFNYEDSVLDIGCGTGKMALAIGDRVKDYTGIDLSKKVLKIAERKKVKGQKFLQVNMLKTGFKNEQFSKIIALTSIDQVFAREDALLECNRILDAKGSMYIEIRNNDYLFKKFFRKILPIFNKIGITKPMPIDGFKDLNYNEWISLIDKCGFYIVDKGSSLRPYYGDSLMEKIRHMLIEICKIVAVERYQYMLAFVLKKNK